MTTLIATSRLARAAALHLGALLLALPAMAQQAGTYTGTTSQGLPVTLVIGLRPDTLQPALTFVNVTYAQSCAQTGRFITDGYAMGTDTALDARGGFNKQIWFIRAHGAMKARFNGTDTYTGSTSLYAAKLLPTGPLAAENCDATGVTFRATLNPAAAAAEPADAAVSSQTRARLGSDGRSRVEHVHTAP